MSEGFLSETHSWTFGLVKKRERQQFVDTHTTPPQPPPPPSHFVLFLKWGLTWKVLSLHSISFLYWSCLYSIRTETFLVLLLGTADGGQTEPFLIDQSSANLKTLTAGKCLHEACKNPLWFRISLLTSYDVEMQTTDRLFPPSNSKRHSFSKAMGWNVPKEPEKVRQLQVWALHKLSLLHEMSQRLKVCSLSLKFQTLRHYYNINK